LASELREWADRAGAPALEGFARREAVTIDEREKRGADSGGVASAEDPTVASQRRRG
jgi:hypothetical protein